MAAKNLENKDKENKKPNRKRKINAVNLSWFLLAIMFVLLLIVTVSLIIRQNNTKASLLEERNEIVLNLEAQKRREQDLDQLEAIQDEPEAIERIAREELGMVKKNEILFEDYK